MPARQSRSCIIRNSAHWWTPFTGSVPAYGAFVLLMCLCFRDITESTSRWLEPGKNYLLKAIYLTNIDICFKLLSTVHYLANSTGCPNSANNFFNTLFTTPELLFKNSFCYWTSSPVRQAFCPHLWLVGWQKQCWALWVYLRFTSTLHSRISTLVIL